MLTSQTLSKLSIINCFATKYYALIAKVKGSAISEFIAVTASPTMWVWISETLDVTIVIKKEFVDIFIRHS